ncbi:MAG: PKD domain-containing protein, partial [Thermoplasmata archaeon]|nr:PKD domain-containing protein [Thermoplasmata archaeon]
MWVQTAGPEPALNQFGGHYKMIRKNYLLILLLILGVTLVVASAVSAADELEIFAGQDKTVRVNTPLEFNDALINKPNPLDPDRTYTFSWDFDNKKNTDLDTPPIFDNDAESNERFTEWTYHIPGVYIVTLTVEDGFNTVKDTLQVTVKANEPPEIHVNSTESAFKDVEHIFYGDATDDNAPPHLLRWHWEFGDGESSDDAPPVRHVYGSVRGYQVKVRVTDPDNDYSVFTIFLNVVEKPGEMGSLYPIKDG